MTTAIIILNWNGADDTISCLCSLEKAKGSFFVVVADNGSSDDSVERLRQYSDSTSLDLKILELGHNYGFAVGNNKGVAYASDFNPDSYLLLNNDTEVTEDFLVRLQQFQLEHSDYSVLTPRINLFYKKDHIWNCGGTMRLGFRKYRYPGQNESVVAGREWDDISFVTGCALFFMPAVLDSDGTILTDRYFFGEEDFDFSMRMKARHLRMACVYDSLIYHKVGSAGKRMDQPGKVYLHLLNRHVDVRLHSSALGYFMWRLVAFPSAFRNLKRTFPSSAFSKYHSLIRDSKAKDRVTEDDFRKLVITGDYRFEKREKVEVWGVCPPPLGGISIYCQRLAAALHAVDSTVVLKNFAKSRPSCSYVRNVSAIWEFLRLPFVSRRIIHVQLRNVWFLTALYFLGFRHDIVITLHNRKMMLLEGWRRRMMGRFLNRTRAIVFNDPTYVSSLQEKFGTDQSKMVILPTFIPPTENERRGVPDQIREFCAKHSKTISSNASIILYNNWGDVYGLEQLIGLMDNLVNRRGMDVGLLFLLSEVGNKDYYEQCLNRIDELGLKDNFLFMTALEANGCEIWEQTDLFVRATRTDMEGISVKEALMTGTPAVASDVCTRPRQAILYKSGDVDDLTEKCVYVLTEAPHVEYVPETDVPQRIMEIYDSIRA